MEEDKINGHIDPPELEAGRAVVHEKSRLRKMLTDVTQRFYAMVALEMLQPWFTVMVKFRREKIPPSRAAEALGQFYAEMLYQLVSHAGNDKALAKYSLDAMTARLNQCFAGQRKGLIIQPSGPSLVQARIDETKLKL